MPDNSSSVLTPQMPDRADPSSPSHRALPFEPEVDDRNPETLGLRVGARPAWQRRLKRMFNSESCSGSSTITWFCPAYVIDWAVALTALAIAKLYIEPMTPYQRDLSLYYHNPDYRWSLRHQQVNDKWVHHFAASVPMITLILLNLICHPIGGIHLLPTLHHSLLGLATSHALALVPTNLLKISIGELRPDFFSRCTYSEATQTCIPHLHNIRLVQDGMKSFPSGHSSSAHAGLGFLSLWIAGRNGAFAIGGDGIRGAGPLESRLLKGLVSISGIAFASWISVTRVQDHRHHAYDVIAGTLIGLVAALLGYLLYFPSPFHGHLLGTTMGQPRLVYSHHQSTVEAPTQSASSTRNVS